MCAPVQLRLDKRKQKVKIRN